MSEHLKIEGAEFRLIESRIYVGSDFYSKAQTLRSEFDKAMLGEHGQYGGMTPLTYAYYKDAYQFLTAGAERCFSEEVLADLVETLEQWARNVLGASHVSTPQVRVYIRGCSRQLFRDEVTAPWHFMLSLTANDSSRRSGRIRILPEKDSLSKISINKVVTSVPVFNQLLVHSTHDSYSIEGVETSVNPLEGTVLLDGYMW